MRILILDNYDSFTYNLMHLMRTTETAHCTIDVIRNDRITPAGCDKYDKLIFSPGPGIPDEAGNMKSIIEMHAAKKAMLGVCLGHQAIGEVFGATLKNLDTVFHGVATDIDRIAADYILDALPERFTAGRYHSWVIAPQSLPASLEVTAVDHAGNIMAIRHREFDIHGVQFHPESILTPEGRIILHSFITGEL